MEAPKPFFLTPKPTEVTTNIDEKDKIMTDIKSFEMDLTNEKYTLELAKSENNKNIIIKLSNNKNKKLKYFISYLNIDSFYSLNSFFKFYQDINELYKLLFDTINKKKYSIDIKDKAAKLILEFLMPGEKVIDVNFELFEEKIKSQELMDILNGMVNELNADNEKIKEEINNLKNENKNLNEELKNKNEELIQVKNNLNNITNEMKKLKEENNEIKNKLKSFEEILNKNNSNNITNEMTKIKEENNEIKNKLKSLEEILNKNNSKKYEEIPEREYSIKKNKNEIKEEKKDNEIKEEEKSISEKIKTEEKKTISERIKEEEKCISEKIKEEENIKEEKEKNEIKEEKEEKKEIESKEIKIEKIEYSPKKNNEEEEKISIKKEIDIEELFNESKIIKNEEDKKILFNWISSKGNINEIKLIYRASEHGDDSESFFNRCSNMGPTISIIKTKKGKIFGGFTTAEWVKEKIKLKDNKAFLFSINNKKKYDILKPEIAISCYPEKFTLMYGNNDDRFGVRLLNGFLGRNSYENLESKAYDVSSKFCLAGNNIFLTEDVEVFQVIFIE